MPSPSKAKGSSFERDVAKFLTDLYGEPFTRVPNSGAYIGASNAHRKEFLHEGQIRSFKGDIIPGQSFPKMNIECKAYKDFPFHLLLTGNPIRQLDEWIDQLLEVADEGDFNILIMKFNNKGKYVLTPLRYSPPLGNALGLQYNHKSGSPWIFSEFNNFWLMNKDPVKALSGTQ